MKRCVALNSGGMDSTVLLGALKEEGNWDIFSLFVNYGQSLRVKEQETAEYFALQCATQHDVITMDFPQLSKRGYIEARNTWLLGFALAHAEIVRAEKVFVGFRESDETPYAKDQSAKFLKLFNKLTRYAINSPIPIVTPFHKINSSIYIIELGYEYWGEDIARTVSCTDSVDGRDCGRCRKCLSRAGLFTILNNKNDWHLQTSSTNM